MRGTGRTSQNSRISIMSQKTLSGEQVLHGRPFSPAVSRASRSPVPGSEKARRMTATSGLKCLEWCSSPGRLGLLEKMLLASTDWRSMRRLPVWSVQVTPAGRSYFLLKRLVPRISGIDASLLPTPKASDAFRGDCPSERARRSPSLVSAIHMVPTPCAADKCGHAYQYDRGDRSKPRLTLAGFARLYPTPCAQDGRNSTLPPSQQRRDTLPGELIRLGYSGQMNPTWEEWLMGFPHEWTALRH